MYALKDVYTVVKNRFEFFRGSVPDAGGKDLLYRLVASSERELKMLEEIENKFEPTTYEFKPGHHVEIVTPEVCRQIEIIYREVILDNVGEGGGNTEQVDPHRETARDGKRLCKGSEPTDK